MTRLNLGKVLVTLEGEHDATRAYDKYCEVTSGGSSYVSKKAVPIGTLITDTAFWQKRASKGADGTDGTNGDDGEDAYQPFKGWFDSSSALSAAYPTPQVGDFAYVKGATTSDPTLVYECNTAGTWSVSQREFNPANNQSFGSGEELNTVHIVDGLDSSSATDVLSAKQGKVLKQNLDALGPEIRQSKPRDIAEDGLWICDASGKALLRLDTLDTKGGVGTNLANTIKGLIESAAADGLTTIEASAIGETLTSLIQALVEEYAPTPTPSGGNNVMEVVEDGFYLVNENGEALAYFSDGIWHFGNVDGIAKSVAALAGSDGARVTQDFSANERVLISNFPRDEKKGTRVCFGGKLSSTFGSVRVGRYFGENYHVCAEVTSTKIRMIYTFEGRTSTAEAEHGLTISTFINVLVSYMADDTAKVTVQTLGGWYSFAPTAYEGSSTTASYYMMMGQPYAQTIDTAMTGCELSAHNPDMKCPVWMFGDSYMSVSGARWMGCLKDLGYWNFYLNALPGRTSGQALEDLQKALNWGTPKYLVFALITNDDSATTFSNNISSVIDLCKERGIIPIFTTQGGLPNHDYRAHCSFILSTGERYIDFAHAVATNGWELNSEWYTGLLYTDNVHPTNNGARTLVMQALKDMPEIMQLCEGGID